MFCVLSFMCFGLCDSEPKEIPDMEAKKPAGWQDDGQEKVAAFALLQTSFSSLSERGRFRIPRCPSLRSGTTRATANGSRP